MRMARPMDIAPVGPARLPDSGLGRGWEAAAVMGARLAGENDPEVLADWARVGALIGEAYQVADDLRDAVANQLDKPLGQDALHGRPNAVHELGPRAALERLHGLVQEARETIPACVMPQKTQLCRYLNIACVCAPPADPHPKWCCTT